MAIHIKVFNYTGECQTSLNMMYTTTPVLAIVRLDM